MEAPETPHKESKTFTANVFTLFTGNAIALAFPVLLYPLLSRVFDQEDYALFGLYFSVFAFLEIGSCGRYDFAVVVPEDDESAINLISGGILFSFAYALIVLLSIFLFGEVIADYLKNDNLSQWLYLLPLSLILVSVSKLFNGWLVRGKHFRAAAINRASQKIGESSSQLLLGLIPVSSGLIIGDILGRFLNALLSVFQSLRTGFDRHLISLPQVVRNLSKYAEFPKYNVLPSMLNALAGMLPVIMISAIYTVDDTGNFNFSRIVLSIPIALVSSGVSNVLMQQVSEKKRLGLSIATEIFSLGKKLLAVSIAGVVLFLFLGEPVFEIVFGAKWARAGEFTSILIFSYALSFIVSSFSVLLILLGRIKWSALWQLFYLVFVSTLWLVRDVPVQQFLLFLVVVDIIAYTVYAYLIIRSVNEYEQTLSV